ncbi:hypothetical protein B0H14DRAFT_2873754 [Mycena olivaceomarginata]|nr:hypothetical protein B0H14DRAFT_2873754 [Mycena olivaceomarginata]
MAAPTLSIAPISSLTSLPNASPNLMPFHVDHDGPAPISTYFLVDAAEEHTAKPPLVSAQDVEMEPAVDSSTPADVSPEVAEPPADKGLKVDFPSGYAGVIMTGEGSRGKGSALKKPERAKAKARASKTNRATRSATRDDADEMEGDEEAENGQNSRILKPTAQFSSFVLWHPDIPVDPARDEYLRSLTEWIRLADEIHHVED